MPLTVSSSNWENFIAMGQINLLPSRNTSQLDHALPQATSSLELGVPPPTSLQSIELLPAALSLPSGGAGMYFKCQLVAIRGTPLACQPTRLYPEWLTRLAGRAKATGQPWSSTAAKSRDERTITPGHTSLRQNRRRNQPARRPVGLFAAQSA